MSRASGFPFVGSLRLLLVCGLLLNLAYPAVAQEGDEVGEELISKWDRLIYVPFRELGKVFDRADATVVLPYEEYMALMKAWLKTQQQVNGQSPDAVVTESEYHAAVEKEVVRISVLLKVNVLKSGGWSAIPLTFGTAAIGGVRTDVGDVLLQGVGPGQYQLLLSGDSGERTVSIDLLAAVRTSPESRSFEIQCPPTAVSQLQVTIPEPDQAVTISPVQVLLPGDDQSPAGVTSVRAALGATDRIEVRWNASAGSRPVMDLLIGAANITETRIEPGLLQTRTVINYEILRGELRELAVLAPLDARIVDVVSAQGRIREWKAETVGETHQRIQIELLTPVTERFQIEVQSERSPVEYIFQLIGRSDDGKLHGVHADQVVRETGRLTVTLDSALTIVVQQQSGVRQVDVDGVRKGSGGEAGTGQAWEFAGQSGRLVVQSRPVEPRLLAEHSAQVIFGDDELRLRSVVNYTVERAGVFQLVLNVPSSLTVDRVSADGMSEFSVDRESGRLTLSLTQQRMGAIAVTVLAHQAFDSSASGLETEIPWIEPENVERETGTITVYAPEFLDVSTVEENLVGLFAARDLQVPAMARLRHIASWSYARRPVVLFLRTSPRPAQLSAVVGLTAHVEPDIVRLNSVIDFEIRNAGIDTLRIAVPESVASDVRFTALSAGRTIQQRTRSPDADAGWVTWTLVLQEETTGTVRIGVDWEAAAGAVADLGPNGSGSGDPGTEAASPDVVDRQFELQPPRVLPPFNAEQVERRRVTLTQSRGEIRVLRHASLSISAEGPGVSVETIDVRELELLPREGYLAFRYFVQPASATIRIRKHEIHEVVATVVSRAAVEVMTEKQELASYRCRFRITSSERQRLRIDLPANSELQAPLLNGQRTTMERAADVRAGENREAYYVNISRDQTSDQQFLLTVQFRCPIVAPGLIPFEQYGSVQILRLPTIGSDDGSTVVQQIQLAVWGPKDVTFVGEPARWTQIGRSDSLPWTARTAKFSAQVAGQLNEWLHDGAGGTGDFAAQGHLVIYRAAGRHEQIELNWRNRPFLYWLISGTCVLVGLILRRTTWENRITVLLVAALFAGLWSLNDGLTAMQFVAAALPGLLVVAGIWIAGMLFRPAFSPSAGVDSSAGFAAGSVSGLSPAAAAPMDAAADSTVVAKVGASVPPPATPAVAPSPEVRQWMNDLMGGK